MKTFWVISGGIEAVPGIRRAKEMGFHVVVSDRDPEAPGFAFADDKIIADTYDAEATVQAAKEYYHKVRPINGVMCIAADVPVTVASVADALGLPGISLESARLAMNKLEMKHCFAKSNIPIPWFSAVESLDHLKSMTNARGFPLVLKPVDSRGARGVLKLEPGVDLNWAYQYALKYSPSGHVIVEEYLEGPQISTESIIMSDRAYTPGFTDRNYEHIDLFAPYIIENGGQQPSVLSTEQQCFVAKLAEEAGRAMGIKRGIVKGDMVLTETGPRVIEIAARLSGGWFSTDQIPLATGVDLIAVAIKMATDEEVTEEEMIPRYQKGVAIRYFFPEHGKVVKIKNNEQFASTPWVHRLGIFVKPGDIIEPVTDHTKRAGFVITEGATRDEAVARAMEVVDTIQFETVPV